MIEIRPAHIDDALRINVRAVDCREIWRMSMSDPEVALKRAISMSRESYTATFGGDIIGIFGVRTASVINRVGTPWLLGSDLITTVPFEFLAQSKEYIEKLKVGYTLLQNYVDVENRVSIRWLRWLGFKIDKNAVPYGLTQKPFRRFTMECL